jgi:predicted lipoprotein with Yx(FWY)xxD motif
MHRLIISSALALIVLSSPLSAAGERGASGDAAVVKVAFNKKLRTRILVDAKGFTLYLFTEDAHGALACVDSYDHCPTAWPPLRSNQPPVAGKGVHADLLGTIPRPDGDAQVTYKGHPLYTNAGSTSYGLKADVKPGQIRGQAFVNAWFVVSPQGKAIREETSLAESPAVRWSMGNRIRLLRFPHPSLSSWPRHEPCRALMERRHRTPSARGWAPA